MENRIITVVVYPPIPLRCFDWSAYRENYDEGDPIGWGETRAKAEEDLINQEEIHNDK